jgi:pyridoxal phosphate enzyme (YggS family)
MAAGERNVTLLAATKTVPAEVINYAAENLGLTVIGENKVQELLEKYPLLCRDKLEIHLIGHLQTNKVRQIVDKVDMIESLDREDLAKEISKRSLAIGKRMPVLVELNVGKEPEKSGVFPEDTEAFVREMAKYEGIEIVGLMTMAPAKISSDEYKAYFSQVKEIFDRIAELDIPGVRMETLSMGMSDSYEEGAQCGATLVRVGSAIFGKRVYPEQNV